MKLKALNIFIGLFIAACGITSCLDSDYTEYEYSSNSSITAFSITDSIITYYSAVVDDIDTTLSTAVVGTDYPFVINQNEGLIYNPDSLPVGTDVTKVVVGITADTQGIYIVAETDTLWQETDSLNFEKPVQFKVLSEMGTFGRVYTAKINVHQQDPELLSWKKFESNFNKEITEQKAVYMNNCIYVFGLQNEQAVVTKAQTTDGNTWSEPVRIATPAEADITSAMVWGNQIYILAGNELYTSQDAESWEKVATSTNLHQLVANVSADKQKKIIGIDTDNHYVESNDGITWTQYGEMPEGFPTSRLSSASYALDTNKDIQRVVVIGDNGVVSDTIAVTWSQLHSDKNWADLPAPNNSDGCPKFENISMIHYNNMLYAFGGYAQHEEEIEPFSCLYESKDNGITWEITSEKIAFPEEFPTIYEASKGNYSCTMDDNHYIWIMWSQTGEVWRGRINKLGFERQ